LIIGGLAMIAIGVIREDNSGEQAPSATEQTGGGPATTAPAPGGAGAREGQANPAPGEQPQQQPNPQTQTQPQNQGAEAPSGGGVALDRRRFARRFALGVPPGWQDGSENGAITLTAPGATAEVDVFFESGRQAPNELARAARDFLASRHDGAQVGKPTAQQVGGVQAARVTVTYPAGEEVAVLLSSNGFSFLVLRRVDRGASPDIGRQADAALASFRPQ
jgi:hypothetical protein